MFDNIGKLQRVADLLARHVVNDLNPEEIQELRHWKATTAQHNTVFSELTDINGIVTYLENRMLV